MTYTAPVQVAGSTPETVKVTVSIPANPTTLIALLAGCPVEGVSVGLMVNERGASIILSTAQGLNREFDIPEAQVATGSLYDEFAPDGFILRNDTV